MGSYEESLFTAISSHRINYKFIHVGVMVTVLALNWENSIDGGMVSVLPWSVVARGF